MDWEAQDDGFLAKIIMDEGSKDVSVGTPVAVVVEEEEHVSTAKTSALKGILTRLLKCQYQLQQ